MPKIVRTLNFFNGTVFEKRNCTNSEEKLLKNIYMLQLIRIDKTCVYRSDLPVGPN